MKFEKKINQLKSIIDFHYMVKGYHEDQLSYFKTQLELCEKEENSQKEQETVDEARAKPTKSHAAESDSR